ncbi:MAG TPA: hypothetical protein VKV02_01200 [Acidobacteriaceae bacterium]|nr:hypothetical protein [Acidobacteriaceae bacterium]
MRVISRGWVLVGLLMAVVLAAPAYGQVALTTVADTVYSANGAPAQGTVVVSWGAFTTASGAAVAAGQTSTTLGAAGALSLGLAPNAGATPTGSYYTAIFHLSDGTTSRQYWVVPAGGPVKLSAIENQVLPTSVAMQTVSKAYVDQAIAAAVTSGGSPGASTTPSYVLKTGDTMTGPLVLPADPVSAYQAADKHYVDTNVAALSGGAANKVSTLPSASQAVVQPAGTQLEVNSFNGLLDATGFLSGGGNNGVSNALSSPPCTSGCEVWASDTYPGTEGLPLGGLPARTRIVDRRGGSDFQVFQNPLPTTGATSVSSSITQITTRTAQQSYAERPSAGSNNMVMVLTENAQTGGSNQFPADAENVPYNKNNYGVLQMVGNYNTQGQHVQAGNVVNCYSVGDCLAGGQFITSSGGYRDQADEGTHPFDLQVSEDPHVFQGTCGSGCTTGSTSLMVNITASAGTQGDGRYLMDKSPSKVISAGAITGASGDYLPIVNFSGTNFPVSKQLMTAAAATSQAGNLAPGTVTLPIVTTGLSGVYSTSTAALPSTTGVACVMDQGTFPNFETATYSVVDASHLQLTLNKVHKSGAVISVGGLCGYGLEEVADTVGQVRQIFPVAGSPSPTQVYYASALTYVVGVNSATSTSAFLSASAAIASATRSGNAVTLNLAQQLPYDMNGLSMTVSGMADASYNGTFQVTTTGPYSLAYTANGADGSSSGGTVSFANGSYALYPMAEVLSVYDPGTGTVDGKFTLAANTVAWAAGDAVEEPHFYQQEVYGDTEYITQFLPRPTQYASAGKIYSGLLGPGARGWSITNSVPASSYVGGGGTHQLPDSAYVAAGPWKNSLEVDAGTEAVLRVHCNLQSCSRWDSGYSLFAMDRNGGVEDFLTYAPQSSSASWLLGGTSYTFSPAAFTAPTIQATNIVTSALKTGSNGNAQIAAGGSAGYSNFTLNGNNTDGQRIGFIGGGNGDLNLYLDVPTGGQFNFRFGSVFATSMLTTNGLTTPEVITPKLASGTVSNTDAVGTLTVGTGSTTSASYSFTGTYASAPVCVVQPQNATPAAALAMNGYVPQVTSGSLSIAVGAAPASSVVFGYQCIARN